MSDCPTTSLVAVAKEDAGIAATAIIAAIKQGRIEEREKTVQKLMAPGDEWEFTWAWPFMRRLTRSREEAEALADGEWSLDHAWRTRWRHTCSYQETRAESYLAAARMTQDGVLWLNLTDAAEVAAWVERAAAAQKQATS